ncbi:MAG: hypothetical protein SCL54_15825 [Bacillota bacterium]|nr:hypothetical protein [Bacillota bacterium]
MSHDSFFRKEYPKMQGVDGGLDSQLITVRRDTFRSTLTTVVSVLHWLLSFFETRLNSLAYIAWTLPVNDTLKVKQKQLCGSKTKHHVVHFQVDIRTLPFFRG